ncbi:MAG: serine hydrolase [Gemmatimonadota bacterium]
MSNPRRPPAPRVATPLPGSAAGHDSCGTAPRSGPPPGHAPGHGPSAPGPRSIRRGSPGRLRRLRPAGRGGLGRRGAGRGRGEGRGTGVRPGLRGPGPRGRRRRRRRHPLLHRLHYEGQDGGGPGDAGRGGDWLTREITVRDLLTHRAGLGNADYLWYETETDLDEILARFAHAPLAYSPRSSFIYQNIMYAAAGAVVEAASGMSWEAFVQRRIFDPLGMEGTRPLLGAVEGEANVARPHDRVEGQRIVIENASVDPVKAAGSVWSSVNDMSRWLRLLLADGVAPGGQRLLDSATVAELFRPQTLVPASQFYPTARLTRPHWTTYGLGWFQHDYRGEKVDFHTGSIDGMVAIAGLIRDQGLGVYVLGNLDHVEVRHALMYRVFDLYLAQEDGGPDGVRDWSSELRELYDGLAEAGATQAEALRTARRTGTSPSHPLEAYTGRYGAPRYGELRVTLEDGGLRVYRGPGLQGPLEHWHYDTFRARWDAEWRGETPVTFQEAADGSIGALVVGGERLERIPPAGDG